MTQLHHSCLLLASLLVLFRPAIGLATTEEGFDRYKVILSRMPFGDSPPDPTPIPAPVAPAESFAQNLRVCSIMEEDGTGEVRVGIVDSQSNKTFLLREGEMEDGIELISASLKNEEAVLQKGSEIARIDLASGEITAISPGDAAAQRRVVVTPPVAPAPQLSTAQASYQDRRKVRQDRRRLQQEKELERRRLAAEKQARMAEERKKYTGEELRKQLQDYNLEAIRQGLPALPLELTQEQDDKLVAENILPPRDAIQEAIAAGAPPPDDGYDEEFGLEDLPLEELLLEEEILEEVLGFPEGF